MVILDDAFLTRRIRSIIGLEPPRANEYPFFYKVGDRYREPNQHEPLGAIEEIRFHEQYLGDHSELWFDLVVNGEAVERISSRAVAAVGFSPTSEETG